MQNNNEQQVFYTPPQQSAEAPAPYTPQYPPYVKKVYSPLEKRDTRFFIVTALLAFLLTDFAFFKGFHLGFTIAYAVVFIASTVYLWNGEKRQGVFPLICGAVSLAGAVTLSLYTNIFVNAIMVVLIAGLFTVYCLGISGSFNRPRGNFKMLFDLAGAALLNPLENLSDVFGSVKASTKTGSKNLSVLIGMLLALPALFVIIPLLISSDAAFEGLWNSIIENIGVYLLELAAALVLTPFAFSYLYGKRKRLNVKENGVHKGVNRAFPAAGAVSFLSVISLVYVVYLFSQLAYFFSAFKGILPEGYKYNASVFARRGFFEMFAIVAINIALISVINAFTKRNKGRVSPALKGISLFISLFSVLMLAIAMQKMRLNIATYGYTRNRLLVWVFMIMMLFVIAFFIIHIFAPKVPYMQAIIVFCSVLFVVLSFADINTMTAEYNTAAYQDGRLKSVNVEYLAELGDGVVPSLVKLTRSDYKKTAAKAEIAIIKFAADTKCFDSDKDNKLIYHPADFRAYSKAKAASCKAITEYFNSLDKDAQADFISKFSRFKNYYFEYDKDKDIYADWEYDEGFEYNKDTCRYEYVKNIRE